MSEFIEWSALANVVLVGTLVGAGIPALFALGVRAISNPGARDESGHLPASRRAVAVLSFGVAIAAALGAIGMLVAGGH